MPEYLVHGSKLKTYDQDGYPIIRETSYSFITESNQGRITTVEYPESEADKPDRKTQVLESIIIEDLNILRNEVRDAVCGILVHEERKHREVAYTETDTYWRYFFYPDTKTVRLETTVQKETCSPRQKPTNYTTITNKFLQPQEIPQAVLQKLKH